MQFNHTFQMYRPDSLNVSICLDILDVTIIYPADVASDAVVYALSGVKDVFQYLSTLFVGIEGTSIVHIYKTHIIIKGQM